MKDFIFSRRNLVFTLGREGVTLIFTIGSLFAGFSDALGKVPPRRDRALSVDYCSSNPDVFKVRPLKPEEAVHLVWRGDGVPSITKFVGGHVISGKCTRFIKSFANLIILTNNSRLSISGDLAVSLISAAPTQLGTGLQAFSFTPPKNILSISSNFGPSAKHGLSYVSSQSFGSGGRIALWSDGNRSVVGTIRCANDGESARCTLDHLILSSPYRIREFGFLPAPHPEMQVGSLWFWIRLGSGEDALARYIIKYGKIYE